MTSNQDKDTHMPAKVRLGCDGLFQDPPEWFRSSRLGLLVNQASVNHLFQNVSALVKRAGGDLTCLFSPQHGFHGEKQANMVESEDSWDSGCNIPVVSLYGSVRQPSSEMLDKIDVLLIDLPDVGTRVYTYGTTMGLCMEAAAALGKKVVVLDRPNPINGSQIEGNLVLQDHRSFVGRYPIPMRHGLTMGELARFISRRCGIECDLEVIPIQGWKRGDFFPDTGLAWIHPSPNMPSWETALLYPGMVLLEGTNISEGRGTTLPFHLFGAPFIDHRKLGAYLDDCRLEGVVFRHVCFEPVFDKWAGEVCNGFQVHITNRETIKPYRLGLCLLQGLLQTHGELFQWLPPPYEYEREKLPIDILIGNTELRRKIESGTSMEELEEAWAAEVDEFRSNREDCLLYGEV
jgi:uncharacterized protein YbbC (DUF1343 family)